MVWHFTNLQTRREIHLGRKHATLAIQIWMDVLTYLALIVIFTVHFSSYYCST